LEFDQIDTRHMTIKKHHAKTCKWLLEKSEYLDWFNTSKLGKHHGLLWIKGNPGTGKSTLMKFALDNARNKIKDGITISFFFNARGCDLERSTIGMYRSLLLQLLKRCTKLQCVFDTPELATKNRGVHHQWTVESLEELFEKAILKLERSSLMCFIDALDECEENEIRDMISFFEHVGKLAVTTGIRFQVLFSSRHYPHITIKRGLQLVLDHQQGHNQDIVHYVNTKLKIGHSKLAEQIRDELQGKASGVFLWVVLVVKILNKEHDDSNIEDLQKKLHDIPADLHELFRDLLTRDSNNRQRLLLCIQ
jgi:adenylylsulfate kinase-like enzyme